MPFKSLKSTKVRLHGNNARDKIIAHMISGDAQIYIDTNRHIKHKVILGRAAIHFTCGRLLKATTRGHRGIGFTQKVED